MGYLKDYGIIGTSFLIKNKLKGKKNKYKDYLKDEDRNEVDLPKLKKSPIISVILYSKGDFQESLLSILNQVGNIEIELIIVSDRDIVSDKGCVIIEYGCERDYAFKLGFEMAKGEFIYFLDDDVILNNTAFYYMLEKLNYCDFDMVYSDEDRFVEGVRVNPFFKPSWSRSLIREFNYVGYALIRKSLINEFNGYFELLFDLSYKNIKVCNVERVLVHYKKRLMEEKEAQKYLGNELVSIIIPSKDNFEILERCIKSIREKTSYKNFEIIVVDNGSCESVKEKVVNLADKYIYEKREFNFSYMCNLGAKNAKGDYLLFLNDDTEVITSNWLEGMLGYASCEHIGAVGAKLLYPKTDLIQHCGILNSKNGPIHSFANFSDSMDLYFGRNVYGYSYMAVTGACLMVKREKFNGFDEKFPIAYNDVDLCFRLYERGFENVVANNVKLYHYESISRGNDRLSKEKKTRLYKERKALYKKHKDFYFVDKMYNNNLSGFRADFTIESKYYRKISKIKKVIYQPNKYFDDFDFKIESLESGDILKIGGYAYKKGHLCDVYVLIFTRDDVAISFKTSKVFREDIAIKYGKRYITSGFSCNVDTKLFEDGKYRIGLMLVDLISRKKHIEISEEVFSVRGFID